MELMDHCKSRWLPSRSIKVGLYMCFLSSLQIYAFSLSFLIEMHGVVRRGPVIKRRQTSKSSVFCRVAGSHSNNGSYSEWKVLEIIVVRRQG
jgi:hypothetical protein